MPKEQTLEIIEEEIAQGKLGVARDRLHGLVNAYPNDLDLRFKLGELYFKLGYPNEAGCYWFLLEQPSEEQKQAIDTFVKSCGGSLELIVKRLKFRGDVPPNVSDEIRTALEKFPKKQKEPKSLDRVWLFGCAFVGLFVLFAVGKTVVELFQWLFSR